MFTFFSKFKNYVLAELADIKAAFQRIEQKLDAMFGATKAVTPAVDPIAQVITTEAAPAPVVDAKPIAPESAAPAVAQEQATRPVA